MRPTAAKIEDLKDIMLAVKSQLPGVCPSIQSGMVEIMTDDYFELLPTTPRFPFVGILSGGYVSDGNLDPMTEYYIKIAVFVEIFGSDPEKPVVGKGQEFGMLDFAQEIITGLYTLGDLSIPDIIDYEFEDKLPAPDAGMQGEKRILRQRLVFGYQKNK